MVIFYLPSIYNLILTFSFSLFIFRYKLLFTYGLAEDGKDFGNDDGDVDLVPNLVEKVALPILHYETSHCWDMLSQQETVNAIAATKLIVQHLSHESKALADLLVSIHTRLADAVAKLTVYSENKHLQLLARKHIIKYLILSLKSKLRDI